MAVKKKRRAKKKSSVKKKTGAGSATSSNVKKKRTPRPGGISKKRAEGRKKASIRKKARRKRIEARKKEIFLREYSQSAIIAPAAEAANVSRMTVREWQERDEQFAIAMDDAAERAYDLQEKEVERRAIEGIDEPIVYRGEIRCDKEGRPITIKKRSDVLAMFLLNGNRPKFSRQRLEHSGPGGGPIQHNWTDLMKNANEKPKTKGR